MLRSETFLELQSRPAALREKIEGKKIEWVVLDEIQKLPELLDEVHAILEDFEHPPKFALTGSSARKLKRSHANMLGGRASSRSFFPLIAAEMGDDFDLELALKFGSLPLVVNASDDSERIDILQSYVQTYLQEEIRQETQIRNLASFHRFLKVSALMNGQKLNLSNIASESQVKRSTAQGYFDCLVDTLIGFHVGAWHARAKVKEVDSPKFYLFDPGVATAMKGALRTELSPEEKGFQLETLVAHELRSATAYYDWGAEIRYWGTPSENEVDFIVSVGGEHIGIEVKYSRRWRSEFNKGLRVLLDSKKITRAIGLYTGTETIRKNGLEIFPVTEFLQKRLRKLF